MRFRQYNPRPLIRYNLFMECRDNSHVACEYTFIFVGQEYRCSCKCHKLQTHD